MAGRVNTKFVITLSAVLVLVFGGLLAAALWIKLHNAPELLRKGDAKMDGGRALLAAGKFREAQVEFELAEKLYSKAVFKEQQNPLYVQKWVDSLRAWVPENQSRLGDAFQQRLLPSLRQLAIAKKTDLAAHREYLGLMYRLNKLSQQRKGAEYLISEVERTLLMFRGDPAENGEAQTLRRYRGLIVTMMMTSRGMELTPEQMDLALADLEAAYKADPADAESAVAVMTWYDARARMATTNNKTDDAAAFDAKARESIARFASSNANNTLTVLHDLRMRVYVGLKAGRESSKTGPEEYTAARAMATKMMPEFERAWGLMKARGGDATIEEVGVFQELEGFFTPEARYKLTQEVLGAIIEKHPERPEGYYALAQILSDHESMTRSMALLQKVVDMPQLPVGLDAIQLYSLKAQALNLQALYSFQQWENETDRQSEKAKAFLEASRKYRAEMVLYIGSDSEQLRFVDGLLRFAEGDWLGAKKLLSEYLRRIPGQDIKAEWTLAQCEIRLRNNGAALEMLERIVRVQPNSPGPVLQRAALLNDLGRTADAIGTLEDFLRTNPSNVPANDLLTRIKVSTGKVKSTDAVEGAIFEAARLMSGSEAEPSDPGAAVARMERAIKEGTDPRLHQMLASLKLEQGDVPGAIAALEAGLAAHPSDPDLSRVLEGIRSDDPVAWRLKQIDEEKDASEVDRLLGKYMLLTSAAATASTTDQAARSPQWRADGNAALDKALELAPDDQRVVDRVFTRAISDRDWGAAEKMVERAAIKDYDRVGGAMYKGRLLYARGQVSDAAGVLRDAADKGIADVASLRLLALCYQQLGRAEDAETYYKEAIKLRPTDAPTQVLYLGLLRSQGRTVEALARAKEAEPACRGSSEFMNLLLSLETSVGKSGDALAQREKTYQRDPRNVGNTLSLIGLYIDAKRWDDAKKALDALRSIGDGTDFALAEARMWAEQNNYEKAQAALDDFIKRQDPAKLTSETFVTLGRFLVDRKKYPEGIALMQRGESLQDPKVMEVSRAVGETLIEIAQPDQAVLVFKQIVDAGADGPRQEVRIRMAELYAALNMFKEADDLLKGVKPPTEILVQTQVMLVRADVARGLKEDKKAEDLYNQAVAQFPTDPMVYFRRAQFHMSRGTASSRAALDDLDAAIRVRPGFWQARRLRSFVYFGLGGEDNFKKAIADVKETLRVNTSLDDLRVQLLNELIARDQTAEAAEVADAAATVRPNDIPLVMTMGQTFAQAERWERAMDYYRMGWARSNKQRPDIAQALLNAILNCPTPNLAEAETVLREVQEIGGKDGKKVDMVLSNSGLLLARAKLLTKRGRPSDALKDIMVSMTAITAGGPPTAEQINSWAQEVRRLFPKPQDELDLLSRKDVPAKFYDWSRYLRATLLIENPANRHQAAPLADELLATSKDPEVRRLCYRLRGTLEFIEGRYQSAESMWRKGVGEFPADWELNNNLAYVLARHMNRAADALEFAVAAGKAATAVPEAVDTLGYVLMKLNRNAEAEVEFKKALMLSRSPQTKASVLIHLIRCYLDQNKKDQARVQMDSLVEITRKDPTIEAANKSEIDELNRRLNSP